MKARISALETLAIAGQVIARVGATHGLTGQQMRVLVAVGVLSATGGRPTYVIVAQILGNADDQGVVSAVQVLARAGYVSKNKTEAAVGVRLEWRGQQLLNYLERAERTARHNLKHIKLGRWRRQYIRSGKYVGRAQMLRERKAAKQTASQA